MTMSGYILTSPNLLVMTIYLQMSIILCTHVYRYDYAASYFGWVELDMCNHLGCIAEWCDTSVLIVRRAFVLNVLVEDRLDFDEV